MDEQTFWHLIDELNHDPAATDHLANALCDHSAQDIQDFADHLARALHALDTPAHYQAANHNADFLGVRCAAVAAGTTSYRAALQTPAKLAAFTSPTADSAPKTATPSAPSSTAGPTAFTSPTAGSAPNTAFPGAPSPSTAGPSSPSTDSALNIATPSASGSRATGLASNTASSTAGSAPGLLSLAAYAYAVSTRTPWEHTPPVTTATGSNRTAWGTHWLRPHLGTTTAAGSTPEAYLIALQHVALSLDTDAAWQRWWRRCGLPECELGIVAEDRLDHLRPSADIRKTGERLRANFTCAAPPAGGAVLPLATAELTAMLGVVREALGLGELPPLPQLCELPQGLPDVRVTTKPVPTVSSEVDERGYLTLAQVQEFFG